MFYSIKFLQKYLEEWKKGYTFALAKRERRFPTNQEAEKFTKRFEKIVKWDLETWFESKKNAKRRK